MAEASRDQNYVPSALGVSSVDGVTTLPLRVDPVTGRLLTDVAGGGAGTVTSVSVTTANGVSGVVATATTTPAITLTLGAITPSTVNGLTFTAAAVGFTIAGGTTSKTLTVPLDASVSGTNTGDNATNTSALSITAVQDANAFSGFKDPDGIQIDYNYTNRTITLTGDLTYYYKGAAKSLVSPWTSTAHTNSTGTWFLYSTDGDNFTWSNTVWNFTNVMVAFVKRGASAAASFAVRETHGMMDVEAHEEFHAQIGTYRFSGGGVTAGTIAFDTATDAAVTPGFDSAIIKDEDLATTIPAWTEGTYTTMYIGAGSASVVDIAASYPFIAAGANNYLQVNNVSTGAMTPAVTGRYYNVYQLLVPATADTDSQKYRTIMLQPQATFTSLASAQGESINGLSLGDFASQEYVIYTRITYVTAAGDTNYGKCEIPTGGISYVLGNRVSQTAITGVSPSAHTSLSFLTWTASGHVGTASTLAGFNSSAVAAEYTLTGTGTVVVAQTSPSLLGTPQITSTDAGATGSEVDVYHNSASPAANDVLGKITFNGNDSGAAKQEYASVKGVITSPTAASEQGHITFGMATGGTVADRITFYAASVVPVTNDAYALGSTSNQFSDLFLAEGGVINWDNGDATLTQTGNVLELAGADLTVPNMTVGAAGVVTLSENASIALDPAGSADGKYTGITITGTAGAALAFGDLIYLDPTDSRWELADANAAAAADGDSRGVLGICVLAAAGDGSATTILLEGVVRADTAFPALTIGAPVYVGETAGDIVVTQPVTADVVIRIVGVALTADEIFFRPDFTWVTHT